MSQLVCIMPARNEDWILGLSARAVLMWADHLVLHVHASDDQTERIAAHLAKEFYPRVTLLHEENPVWEEMRHRQRMLEAARQEGASHIVMVDADEVLTGNLLGSIRQTVEGTPVGQTLILPWQCLRGDIYSCHAAGVWGTAQVAAAFRDQACLHWTTREGYDFHHRQPMGAPYQWHQPIADRDGGLMHLQFVNDRRLRAKQALYKATEVIRWPGRKPVAEINSMYNQAVYGQEQATDAGHLLTPTPSSWWAPYDDLMVYANFSEDVEPWQEREMKRLWSEHGASRFAGLDFFGVVQ